MSDSFSEERDDHNREQWGAAHKRHDLSPLYDSHALMEFTVEQLRSHKSIKK